MEDQRMEHGLAELSHGVSGVVRELAKLNSLRRRFLYGVLTGAGSALGASVVAAVALVVAGKILGWFGIHLPTK
jgi:hypothetical protein